MDTEPLCMGCMKPKKESAPACPHCGYRNENRNPAVLPYQAVLNHKFLIGRILGKPGGFGVTYLAWDLVLHTTVAIKEFFPSHWASRSPDHCTVVPHSAKDKERFAYGLEQFLQEARTLARFSHPNVVRVREFFQQNNTAYLVMDYYEGVSLEEFARRKGGRISEHIALSVVLPILEGLREVHQQKFLHRDIKPGNIYLTKGDVPILLDFGAARFASGQQDQSLSVILTPGFAPFEQYLENAGELLGPWTDIYACGATLYAITTGVLPPSAINRHQKDDLISPIQIVPTLTPQLSRAILAALALDREQRPQTVQAFQHLLLSSEPIYQENIKSPWVQKSRENPQPAATPELSQTHYVRCPHCKARNSLAPGQNYRQLHCQQCGNKISSRTVENTRAIAGWKPIALALLLVMGVVLMSKKEKPPPVVPALAVPAKTIRQNEAPIPQSVERQEMPAPVGLAPSNRPPRQPPEDETPPPRKFPGNEPPQRDFPENEPPPPAFAVAACAGQLPGTACRIEDGGQGHCDRIGGQLACRPEGGPPSRSGPHRPRPDAPPPRRADHALR
ncbi:non-specific serine/threonine protein kinase [Gammaproteobacteria bacterium]